ncbi:GNAT family N-acetyltransferase [Kitasatospora sp. NPDC096128]|uniref:GNAT family N-acetyltransferase n=1 Tax=Kitasatospora sp. NPDC096128 TaxID=3155547 RepID=UPI00332969AB
MTSYRFNTDPTHPAPDPGGADRGRIEGLRIRPATPADADTVIDLMSHIDLHQRAEDLSQIFDTIRLLITTQTTDLAGRDAELGSGWRLSHGINHALIAEYDGNSVGMVRCGPSPWLTENPQFKAIYGMRRALTAKLSSIGELAVMPAYRKRGIASALLLQAEDDYRASGYRALTLQHDRSLTSFYTKLGYASASRLTLELPALGRVPRINRGWRQAVKALVNEASVVIVYGDPVLTGLLDR